MDQLALDIPLIPEQSSPYTSHTDEAQRVNDLIAAHTQAHFAARITSVNAKCVCVCGCGWRTGAHPTPQSASLEYVSHVGAIVEGITP